MKNRLLATLILAFVAVEALAQTPTPTLTRTPTLTPTRTLAAYTPTTCYNAESSIVISKSTTILAATGAVAPGSSVTMYGIDLRVNLMTGYQRLDSVVVRGSGTGHEVNDIESVQLWLGTSLESVGVFSADNGAVTLPHSGSPCQFHELTVYVVYIFKSTVVPGRTFQTTIDWVGTSVHEPYDYMSVQRCADFPLPVGGDVVITAGLTPTPTASGTVAVPILSPTPIPTSPCWPHCYCTSTPIPSVPQTSTPTSTSTNTATSTPTPTRTPTLPMGITDTPTWTWTTTPALTATFTNTNTLSPTRTYTTTSTPTPTWTPTPTFTQTPTDTPVDTTTFTSTWTPTHTITPTPTFTDTPVSALPIVTMPLAVVNLLPYPNPADGDRTSLYYELSSSAARAMDLKAPRAWDPDAKVELRVYTMVQRLVWSATLTGAYWGGNEYVWDLKDDWGKRLSNGTYLVQVTVTSKGKISTARQMMMVLR